LEFIQFSLELNELIFWDDLWHFVLSMVITERVEVLPNYFPLKPLAEISVVFLLRRFHPFYCPPSQSPYVSIAEMVQRRPSIDIFLVYTQIAVVFQEE